MVLRTAVHGEEASTAGPGEGGEANAKFCRSWSPCLTWTLLLASKVIRGLEDEASEPARRVGNGSGGKGKGPPYAGTQPTPFSVLPPLRRNASGWLHALLYRLSPLRRLYDRKTGRREIPARISRLAREGLPGSLSSWHGGRLQPSLDAPGSPPPPARPPATGGSLQESPAWERCACPPLRLVPRDLALALSRCVRGRRSRGRPQTSMETLGRGEGGAKGERESARDVRRKGNGLIVCKW